MGEYSQLAGDTIAAIATAPGRGGIGIIRLSGPHAKTIGEVISRRKLTPRQAHYTGFFEPNSDIALDHGLALLFATPNSFTGEDVVELQAHGGPVILDMLLRCCCEQGARIAQAGEFSQRAYLNDKLDLAQAEAIADLISASTESAARSATRSLQGAFSREIQNLMEQIVALRVYVEAAIDFPEEEIDFIAEGAVQEKLQSISDQLQQVLATARQGSLLREGMKLVIAGRPNAGKSSLLNALSGNDSAIVTAIEGTTRDVLREHIQLDGMPLHIVDTAGLRDSGDIIEQEGIKRAWQEMETADRILLVVDDSDTGSKDLNTDELWPDLHQHLPQSIPVTIIHNKCDLSGNSPGQVDREGTSSITLSALSGTGMDILRQHLKTAMGYADTGEQVFIARRRHLQSLEAAAQALAQGRAQLQASGAGELLAEDLRLCHNTLGEITGVMSSDALLGEIFSNFCIGK